MLRRRGISRRVATVGDASFGLVYLLLRAREIQLCRQKCLLVLLSICVELVGVRALP